MPGTVTPTPKQQFFDNNGDPLAAGLVYTYEAGTSTPATTYSDADLTTPNANPIVLDAGGRATIFLDAASYKFDVRDSDDAVVYTQDNVQSTQLAQSEVGEHFNMGGNSQASRNESSYPSGATYDKLVPGSRILSLDSGDITGTWVLRCMGNTEGGTLTVALVNLTDAADTAIVEVTTTDATGEQITSSAITFAAAGATKDYGIKMKTSGGDYASVWSAELVRTA